MTFASAQDLQDRFGLDELLLVADRDRDGVPDVEIIAAALEDADSEIVSILAGVVTIDPDNVPRNVRRGACNIARYRLYQAAPTDDVRQRYEDEIKYFEKVRKGDAGLDGGAVAPTTPQASPKAAASAAAPRRFRRDR